MKATFYHRGDLIYILITHNGQVIRKATGHKGPISGVTKTLLSRIVNALNEFESECKIRKISLTRSLIESEYSNIINGKQKLPVTFFNVFREYMEAKEVSAGTKKRYNYCYNLLLEFDPSLHFDDMGEAFYVRFKKWFTKKKGLTTNTLSDVIKNLKAFCKWSKKRYGVPDFDMDVYRKGYRQPTVEPLKEEEVRMLYNYSSPYESNERARLILLFLCCTGLRVSDYQRMNEWPVINYMLIVKQTKTSRPCYIPWFDDDLFKPVALWELLKNIGWKISAQKLNENIGDLMEEMGFTRIKVTSKTGRKTFSTLNLLKGVQPEIIMKSTGHRTRAAFDAYVGIDTTDILSAFKRRV